MKITCKKSWPANLLQMSNLTFDPSLEVEWGHYTKIFMYLLYILFLGLGTPIMNE